MKRLIKNKFKDNKKLKVLMIIMLIFICYILLTILFLRLTPLNLKIGEKTIFPVTYTNIEKKVGEIIEEEKISFITAKEKEYAYSLTELGITINEDLVKIIKTNDHKFFWFDLSPKDITKKALNLDQEKISQAIQKKLIELNKTPSVNAKIYFTGENYDIQKEKQGDSINIDQVSEEIINIITNNKNYSIDLTKYPDKPQYTEEKLTNKKEQLNLIINKPINLNTLHQTITISKYDLTNYIKVKSDGSYEFNEENLNDFLQIIISNYNNIYYDHNQRIEETYYVNDLTPKIISGLENADLPAINLDVPADVVKKNLIQKVKGIKKTYVEVNLKSQYLWFYQNGKLVLQTPIVSGDHSKGYDTPRGNFYLYGKSEDEVLDGSTVGFDYKYPVDYWMPFNGGVGFHDTKERGAWEYGSDTYLVGGGSHGCINMPFEKAQQLYKLIKIKTPVYVT